MDAGSTLDEVVGFFSLSKPSSRDTAVGITQPQTDMSSMNLPGKGGIKQGRHVKLANLTAICDPTEQTVSLSI
jgi:hypothetical protein